MDCGNYWECVWRFLLYWHLYKKKNIALVMQMNQMACLFFLQILSYFLLAFFGISAFLAYLIFAKLDICFKCHHPGFFLSGAGEESWVLWLLFEPFGPWIGVSCPVIKVGALQSFPCSKTCPFFATQTPKLTRKTTLNLKLMHKKRNFFKTSRSLSRLIWVNFPGF